jgi:hypothetical protein
MLFRWRRQLRAGLLDTTTRSFCRWRRQDRNPVGPSQNLNSWRARSGDAGAGIAGVASVIGLPAGTRIWLAAGVTDLRSGFNGLAAKVKTALKEDPYSGHVFIFRGGRGDLVKVL